MTALTTKQAILDVNDIEIKEIHIEPWKTNIFIKSLSSKQRDILEADISQASGMRVSNFRARFAAASICDKSGSLLFTDKNDVELLGSKSTKAMSILLTAIMELNGITVEAQEKFMENLEPTQGSEQDLK